MSKKLIVPTSNNTVLRLKVLAKGKERVRRKLVVTAEGKESVRRKLVVTAEGKESVRRRLAVTAEQLRLKAKQLAVTAKEKEDVRRKLVVTAERLAVTAKEKESVRRKLAVTAEQLRLKAKQLAVTAKDLEQTRENLSLKAKQLAMTAKEKEDVRRRLAVTAEQLRLKAKQLAVTAKEKESVRRKLAVTAGQLRLKAKNLEQVKAKDEAIISSIGDGLVVADKNGNIMLVNKAFEKILGWKEREVRGKLLSKIVPVADEGGQNTPESERFVTKTLKEHTTITTTVNYLRKDKTSFPVVFTVSPIIVKGNFIGAVEVFRDITKEKEIDKAKTEFVSLASHQLRTPLSVINWYSEMLLAGDAGKLNNKQKKYLDEVYKGNQRMVVLVNALLNVSRLELGTLIIDPEPTDVVKLAQGVIAEFKFKIDQQQLKFDERHSEGLPLLNADPKLLSMVFQNLLSNAIKYTPDKGRVSLDLRLVKRGESVNKQKVNEDSIAIAVSDTGFGIPKNQQDKIFTKLFRADNVREKNTEGTGLGLYIVKSVVDHSGGMIWFESKENKGTTFYVTLPLAGAKKKEGTKVFS